MNTTPSLREKNDERHSLGLTGTETAARSPIRRVLAHLLATDGAAWPTILRVTLGAVMLPHGAQKALGLFHGYGFAATVKYFVEQIQLPRPLAVVVILLEAFGAVALLFGAFTRAAALGIGVVMMGAIFTVHLPFGFFMNWFGNQGGEGYEYHLLVLGIVAAIVIGGGGKGSVDRAVARALAARGA